MTDLYRGPVIDAHHHLWTLAGDHYPWLLPTGGFAALPDIDKLRRDYLPEHYLADIEGQNVVASVHMEGLWDAEGDPVEETRWLDSLPKDHGVASRYVTACPFGTPDTDRIMREQADHDRVVGIRQVIAWHPDPARSPQPDPDITTGAEWRRGAALAEELGLSLDLLMFSWQAEHVVDLASAHPGLTIVVNHAASPIERDPQALRSWAEDVQRLASSPNVVMKISSLGSYDPHSTLESFTPIVTQLVDSFGSDRAMFASDWPVGTMKLTWGENYDLYRQIVATRSPQEQQQLFHDTTARVYRL